MDGTGSRTEPFVTDADSKATPLITLFCCLLLSQLISDSPVCAPHLQYLVVPLFKVNYDLHFNCPFSEFK